MIPRLCAAALVASVILCARCEAGEAQPGVPKLGGYIEGWFYSDSSALSAGQGADNGFRLRRARLAASGQVSDGLGYKLGVGFDGPAPGAASSTARLLDAWMEWRPSEAFRAAFGQIKYEFTKEGAESTPERVPVLRSEAANEIGGRLGTAGGTFRDIGLRVGGEVREAAGLRYSAAVINGNGMNLADGNGSKDIVGRLTFEPLPGLVVGASGYAGSAQAGGAAFAVDERAWAAEAEYSTGGLRLRAEYAAGRWENWDAATASAALSKAQEPWGWYLQASYRPPSFDRLEVMGRYEFFEKDRMTPDSGLEVKTVGAAWYLKGRTRIAANYLFRDPGTSPIVTAQETGATGAAIGDLFVVQALVSF